MKNLCFLLIALLGLSSSAFSGECYDRYCCDETYVEFGVGYRQDSLKWAFPGFSPGESIHESWKDVNIGFVEVSLEKTLCRDYVLYFDADYGVSGWDKGHHVKLVDYNSDAITNRPTTKTKAQVYDISIRLGHHRFYLDDTITVTPQLGWSYNHQKFRNPSFYNSNKVDSTYSWNTLLGGFEIAYQICCEWNAKMNYAFHNGYFHAKIDEFFRSRKRHCQCFGNEIGAEITYQPCCDWVYGLKFNYKHFLGHHKSSVHDAFDNSSHRKRPSWDSLSIAATAGFNF